jgi:hypothetical protein
MIGMICAANEKHGPQIHFQQTFQPKPFANSVGLFDSFDDFFFRPVVEKTLDADVILLEYSKVVSGVSIKVAVTVGDTQAVRYRLDRRFRNSLFLESLRAVLLCETLDTMLAHNSLDVSREFLVLRLAQNGITPLVLMVGSKNQDATSHFLASDTTLSSTKQPLAEWWYLTRASDRLQNSCLVVLFAGSGTCFCSPKQAENAQRVAIVLTRLRITGSLG